MADKDAFALYFSHSWRPRDVDLNVSVWKALCGQCQMLVDVPDEPGANPPYYVHRIEERLQRSDLFVSVLTHREPAEGDFTAADGQLRCSPYSLFEIRLAERADIPRLILFERNTGFKRPRMQRSWEAYVPFDRGLHDRLPEPSQWTKVVEEKIRDWQRWTSTHRSPASYDPSTNAVMLMDRRTHGVVGDVLEECLRGGGYDPAYCDPERLRSNDAFRQLREAGLVIADFSECSPRFEQLYAAVHGLAIPSVRLLASDAKALPWILDGEPRGFPRDLVRWNAAADLPALLKPRIAAMFDIAAALDGNKGTTYLQSKRYAQFYVFISHTLKPPQRQLVDRIFARLDERQIEPFEYHQVNTAGIDWKEALNASLQKTTHFVALLSDNYEQSAMCVYELEQALARADKVSILPFMIGGRAVAHPKLGHLHNRLLDGPDPDANAKAVVDQVIGALEASAARDLDAAAGGNASAAASS